MCNLYSITTNQAAIIALFRVVNRYVGNLPPMPGVFPDYPAPVVRNAEGDRNEGRTKAEEGREKAVVGTLSRRTERLIRWYFRQQYGDAELHPDTILFLSPGSEPVSRKGQLGEWGGDHGSGRPRQQAAYSKDLLSKDFGRVREAEFGKLESRKMIDMRRSGSVEAVAGAVDPSALAAKMGNTIDESRELQKTYLPNQVAVVRMVDEARVIGRGRLRKEQ
jgi:hypothetical protein